MLNRQYGSTLVVAVFLGCVASLSFSVPVSAQTPATNSGTGSTPAANSGTGSTPAMNAQSILFDNPISSDTVEGAIGTILSTVKGVIVVLALVFIVVGAVLYVTSAGNEGRMTLAKSAITASMIGLALGIAAPSFLKEISAALGWTNTDAALSAGGVLTLSQIARNVLDFFLSIVGILSVIMLIVGGSAYLTAAGDEGRAETAKNIVKWAIIGIIVTFASLTIVTQVATLLV